MPQVTEHTKPPKPLQEAIGWLVKLRDENLSDVESHDFADWLTQDIAHAEAFAKAEQLFDNMVLATQLSLPITTNNPTAQTRQNQPVKISPQRNYRPWLALPFALVAAWLFAVTLILPRQSHLIDSYFSDYHTDTGEIRDIQLADGSHILLNTDSAVSVDYRAAGRQIILHHGQARFTVAKDALRPFEVQADKLSVRALGTVFEVYKHTDKVSVTVQEHAVAAWVVADDITQTTKVQVNAGQQLIYFKGGKLQLPSATNLAQASAWQQRRLFINDRPLSDLIAELERYRQGRIFLADNRLKNLHVTGVFSLDNPEAVLSRARKVLGLQETRLGPWWVLLHR